MAAETGEPAATGKAPEANPQKDLNPGQSNEQQPGEGAQAAKGGEPAGGEKKLSNAELKKKAKEEKAARRAQAKAAQPAQPPGGQQSQSGDAKAGKGKPRQDGQQTAQQRQAAAAPKEVKPAIPSCFSHIPMAKRIEMTQADKDVHPAVLMLGQYMSSFSLADSITRLEATLLAFKQVIESYTTPQGTTFSRHFTSHVLSPQIVYLTACRPMCFSMGNAIRWLKLQISKIDIDLADTEAKKLLCESIDNFIRDRITYADPIIAKEALRFINDGDVILTYAHHHLVERTLLYAKSSGKNVSVIVVDDPYERVGLDFSKRLSKIGFNVSYATDLGALRTHLQRATKVFFGAEAMFSNGAMYARAGTCDIAVAAKDLEVNVVAMCETINFTERVSIDSLTYNEIDPERSTDGGFRLLFDTTKNDYLAAVLTELGRASPTSMAATLRKLEEL